MLLTLQIGSMTQSSFINAKAVPATKHSNAQRSIQPFLAPFLQSDPSWKFSQGRRPCLPSLSEQNESHALFTYNYWAEISFADLHASDQRASINEPNLSSLHYSCLDTLYPKHCFTIMYSTHETGFMQGGWYTHLITKPFTFHNRNHEKVVTPIFC